LTRFIYSNGSAILPCLPLVADYIDESTRGKAIGINTIFGTSGMLLSTVFVKYVGVSTTGSSLGFSVAYLYYFAGAGFAIISFLFSFGIKSGASYYKPKVAIVPAGTVPPKIDLGAILKSILKAKPWIAVGFSFGFLIGGNLMGVSQVINLFVKTFYPQGQDNTIAVQDQLIAQLVSVGFAIVYGFGLDLWKALNLVTFACLFGIVTYLSTYAITDPNDLFAYVVMGAIGSSYSCVLLTSNYLGFKYFPPALRGLLLAVNTMFTLVGVILTSGAGLILFPIDKFIPFLIICGSTMIAFGFILYTYFVKIKPSEDVAKSELSIPVNSIA